MTASGFVDTHCHLDLLADPDGAVAEAAAAGVTRIVCMGLDAGSTRGVLELARRHEGVFAGAGHHPTSGEAPDLPALREPGWTVVGGAREMAVNYLLLHDNALDRTHFPYVHPHRIHRGYVQDPPPLRVEVSETTVSYSRTFTPAPLIGWQHDATGLPADTEYVQRETGTFVSPAMHVDEMDIIGPDQRVYRGVFVRAFTPVDQGRTLIIWRAARNYALTSESVTARLREVYEGTMTEDQPLLEAIQASTGGTVNYQVSAAADAAAIRAYQIVEALLAEERGWPRPRRPN